jgi:two-component system, NarL family, nitrate/nitrite response regulator NarL
MEAGRPAGGNAGSERVSILLADDDVPFRTATRHALEEDGLAVVSEAGDAAAAISAATRLRPDICLIELELPGDGRNAIGRIAKASPKSQIVVLSRCDRPEDVVAAFTRGASGYLLKGLTGEHLASTLLGAHRGEPALSRSLVPHLVDEIRRGSVRRVVLPGGAVTLTAREWEVGELLREGYSTAEIAERLGVSPVTVRRHVGLLLNKLGAESREAGVELLNAYGRR